MDVEIEKPHVHHQPTGNRRLDLVLPLAALFVSFVSILIAWHHSQIMRELVHQNEKQVQAESVPYLDIYTSDLAADNRTPELRLTVQNEGVGPARLAEVVMTVDARPVRDFNALVDRCCAAGLMHADPRIKQYRGIRNGEVVLSTLRDRMIRPGESVDAIQWSMTPANKPVVDRLKAELISPAVNLSVCYCSVFEECWTRSDQDRRPVAVKQCPVASVPYSQ